MAFFDEIGRKVSAGGQQAVKQGKALAEIARLNAQISDLEKSISQQYLQIGKMYYEVHKEDGNAEQRELIETINGAFVTIRQCKEQITRLKGTTQCPKCGAGIASGAAFCSVCGEKIPAGSEMRAEEVVYCKYCGKAIQKGQKFCTGCGQPLAADDAAEAAEVQWEETTNG